MRYASRKVVCAASGVVMLGPGRSDEWTRKKRGELRVEEDYGVRAVGEGCSRSHVMLAVRSCVNLTEYEEEGCARRHERLRDIHVPTDCRAWGASRTARRGLAAV
jgi:hypothetical protein